jgi:uracil-DNA glycosylase family protein
MTAKPAPANARDAHGSAAPLVPPRPTIPKLRDAASTCTACELHLLGTQTVFGEGPAKARVMMVGEQPGDREDVEGHPFVGPAGKLLDRSLEEAGIARDDVYITNVVKHFRWEGTRGKRRLHRKPSMAHITACRPWLDAEFQVVKPEVVVCLGATAAQAIAGRTFKLTEHRGELVEVDGVDALVTATVHPSSVLRAPDDAARREARAAFVRDLVAVGRALAA